MDPFSARFPVSLLEPVGASLFLACPETARKSKMVDLDRNPFVFDFIQTEFYRYGHYRLARQFEIRRYAEYEDAGASFVKLLVLNLSVVVYLFFYKKMDKQNRSMLALAVIGLLLLNTCASVGMHADCP